MCITKACEDPTSPGVWWRDDEEWKQYNSATAAAILQGLTLRTNRVKLGRVVSAKHVYGAKYIVDLRSMKQINVESGYTREVKVVNAPAAVVAPAPAANAWEADVASVKENARVHEGIKCLKEALKILEAGLVGKLTADHTAKIEALKVSANGTSVNHCVPTELPNWEDSDVSSESCDSDNHF